MIFNLNLLEAFAELDKLYEENEQSDQFAAGFNEARELLSKNGGIPYDNLIDTYRKYLKSTDNNKDWYAGFFFVVARILAAIPILSYTTSLTTSFLRNLDRLDLELIFMLNAHIVEQALVNANIRLTYVDDTHNTLHPGPGSKEADLKDVDGITFDVKNTAKPDIIKEIDEAKSKAEANNESSFEIFNFWSETTHGAKGLFIVEEEGTKVTIYKAMISEAKKDKLEVATVPISLNIEVFDRKEAESKKLAKLISNATINDDCNKQIDYILASNNKLSPKYLDADNIFHDPQDKTDLKQLLSSNEQAIKELDNVINTCIDKLKIIANDGKKVRIENIAEFGTGRVTMAKSNAIKDTRAECKEFCNKLIEVENKDNIIKIYSNYEPADRVVTNAIECCDAIISSIEDKYEYIESTKPTDDITKNDEIKNNLYKNFLDCWKNCLIVLKDELLNNITVQEIITKSIEQEEPEECKYKSVRIALQILIQLFSKNQPKHKIDHAYNSLRITKPNCIYITKKLLTIAYNMYEVYTECITKVED